MRASRGWIGLVVPAVIGCAGGDVRDPVTTDSMVLADPALADTSTPEDTAAPPACTQVVALDPRPGESGVFYRAPLRVDLDGDGRGLLEVRVRREDGYLEDASISSWSEDGRRALVTTPAPLLSSSRFRLRARTECSDRDVEFGISGTGVPVASAGLAPAWFRLDPSHLRSLIPALDDHLLRMAGEPMADLHIGIEAWNPIDRAYEVAFYGSQAEEDHPTVCGRRVELAPTSGWSLVDNPFLRLDVNGSEARLPLALAGPLGLAALQLDLDSLDPRIPVQIDRVVLSGALSPDRQRIEGLRISVVADARDVVAALTADGHRVSTDQLCNRAAQLGAACQPCGDGRRTCLTSDIDGLVAVRDAFNPSCAP